MNDPQPTSDDPRERRGRQARDAWNDTVDDLITQPKASWRKRWDDLDPNNPGDAFQIEVDKRIGDAVAEPYENLLGSIWLYVDWRWITTQLTTEQRELWADAIDAKHARDDADDPAWGEESSAIDRWWRPDAPLG